MHLITRILKASLCVAQRTNTRSECHKLPNLAHSTVMLGLDRISLVSSRGALILPHVNGGIYCCKRFEVHANRSTPNGARPDGVPDPKRENGKRFISSLLW